MKKATKDREIVTVQAYRTDTINFVFYQCRCPVCRYPLIPKYVQDRYVYGCKCRKKGGKT